MRTLIIFILMLVAGVTASAQTDKREVRRGNRDYKKENYKEAEIEYRKAIIKDSLSVAANYNLAADLYRQDNGKAAQEVLDKIKEQAATSDHASDYFYNLGDAALANQDWQTAVDAFQESLLRNPADLDAKENYIYAKKKLEQQQQQQQQQQNDQNQDNQGDQNQDDKNDQDQDKQDNKDNQDQDKQDQNQDQNQDKNQDQNKQQQPKITPQAAKQMLEAIQAKEKETQDKVQKEKAQALQSRQKERNW